MFSADTRSFLRRRRKYHCRNWQQTHVLDIGRENFLVGLLQAPMSQPKAYFNDRLAQASAIVLRLYEFTTIRLEGELLIQRKRKKVVCVLHLR